MAEAPELQEQQKIGISVLLPKLQFLGLIVAFLLLVFAAYSGLRAGQVAAQSEATYKNVNALNQALTYFFNDQGIYPTPDQLQNQKILEMLYLSGTAVPTDVNGACSAYPNFQYFQTNTQNYTIKFCLTTGVENLGPGLHTLTNAGLVN